MRAHVGLIGPEGVAVGRYGLLGKRGYLSGLGAIGRAVARRIHAQYVHLGRRGEGVVPAVAGQQILTTGAFQIGQYAVAAGSHQVLLHATYGTTRPHLEENGQARKAHRKSCWQGSPAGDEHAIAEAFHIGRNQLIVGVVIGLNRIEWRHDTADPVDPQHKSVALGAARAAGVLTLARHPDAGPVVQQRYGIVEGIRITVEIVIGEVVGQQIGPQQKNVSLIAHPAANGVTAVIIGQPPHVVDVRTRARLRCPVEIGIHPESAGIADASRHRIDAKQQ